MEKRRWQGRETDRRMRLGVEGEREREEIPRRRNPLPGSLVSLLPRITLVIILFGGALSALQALRGCVSALSLSAGKNFGLKCRSLDHEWRVWRSYFPARGLCIREKSERKGDRERVLALRGCSRGSQPAKKRKQTLGWKSENGAKWYRRRECRRRNFRTFQIRCQ